MSDFVEVASTEHVVPGTGALVKVSDTAVAVFNIRGEIFAIDDVCIRCGSSLAAGELHATLIRCPRCGWRYDVTTGCVNGVPALRIQTFEAKVADAAILVANTARHAL
jgi:3-phenylpropionate/trans-cinnamate dioxygenase ferredoxin subunit